MTKLKIHYDGWVVLPAAVRRRFGVTTGDQLDAEWTPNGLLLRSAHSGQPANDQLVEVEPEEEPEVDNVVAVTPAKRPAKKPAKKSTAKKPVKATAASAKSGARLAASTIPRARGRRKATA